MLGACSHVRPPAAGACAIKAYPIRPQLKDPVAATKAMAGVEAAPRARFYDEVLADALKKRVDKRLHNDPGSLLILSGGSQNGAFGGGLLLGLNDPTVYDAVTGVSTGAPQATLAFLARQEVAQDRTVPVDQGDGQYHMKQSNLEDLAVALSISRESTLLEKHWAGDIGAVVDGSKGSLEPLRRRLLGFASDETLEEVGRQARDNHRLLMVGVTNLDDGYGYALDLTELASRVLDGASKDMIRKCYVGALVASSAVPLAAYPVTLSVSVDGQPAKEHLFIDGGARYGVFLPSKPDGVDKGTIKPPNVTMIVNGRLYGGPWRDHGKDVDGRWTTVQLVKRSVDVLSNQVYRFSVDDVARFARDNKGTFRMAYISNEGLSDGAEDPLAHPYKGRSCSAWREHDEKANPLEFHPKYMACLLDYGHKRGTTDPWNYTFQTLKAAP